MPETNYNPDPGTVFSIPPEADDGAGSSSSGSVLHVVGTGSPPGAPSGSETIAYNDAGKVWLNVSSTWQERLE